METLTAILFWGCLGILIYIYAGYTLALQLLARLWPYRHDADDSHTPSITLLFSARNECASLPAKMESLRRLEYPREKIQVLIASDASTDGTDEYLAAQEDVEWVPMPSHSGKNAALNALLTRATGDILFFTDANTILHPGCIRAAARHFSDPQVGVVAGELRFIHGEDWNAIDRGVGLYWRYENAVKVYESRLGSLLVGGGALLAVRRELVQVLDPRIANDLEIPARVGALGYKILYEPACLGFEKAHSQAWEEVSRTSRIVARGMRGFFVLFPVLIETPLRFWQFVSHKVLRWFTLPLAAGMMAGAWGLRKETFSAVILVSGALALMGIAVGAIAFAFSSRPRWIRPFTLAAHLFVMQAAALWGVVKALTGRTPATWAIPESTRQIPPVPDRSKEKP